MFLWNTASKQKEHRDVPQSAASPHLHSPHTHTLIVLAGRCHGLQLPRGEGCVLPPPLTVPHSIHTEAWQCWPKKASVVGDDFKAAPSLMTASQVVVERPLPSFSLPWLQSMEWSWALPTHCGTHCHTDLTNQVLAVVTWWRTSEGPMQWPPTSGHQSVGSWGGAGSAQQD